MTRLCLLIQVSRTAWGGILLPTLAFAAGAGLLTAGILAGLVLLVWAEALRSPGLAAQFQDLFARLRTNLAAVVRDHQREGGLPGGVSQRP